MNKHRLCLDNIGRSEITPGQTYTVTAENTEARILYLEGHEDAFDSERFVTPNVADLLKGAKEGVLSPSLLRNVSGCDPKTAMRAVDGDLNALHAVRHAMLDVHAFTATDDPSGCGAKIIWWPAGLSNGATLAASAAAETPGEAELKALLTVFTMPELAADGKVFITGETVGFWDQTPAGIVVEIGSAQFLGTYEAVEPQIRQHLQNLFGF